MKKTLSTLFLIFLIIADILVGFAFLSNSGCLGVQNIEGCKTNPVTITIVAFLLLVFNCFYFYRRHKSNPNAKPLTLSWRGDSEITWVYALLLFNLLIFLGENIPEFVGLAMNLKPGDPNFHVSLLDSADGLLSSDVILSLFGFLIVSIIFALLLRVFHWVIAAVISAGIGAAIEIIMFNPSGYEGVGLNENQVGGTLFFVISWLALAMLPYLIYRQILRKWGQKGAMWAFVLILILNILSAIFFAYLRYVVKYTATLSQQLQQEMMPSNTCPDQILLNNGPIVVYQNGKELSIEGGREVVDWIKKNCPTTEELFQKL